MDEGEPVTENLQSEMNQANREADADERQERWDRFARAAMREIIAIRCVGKSCAGMMESAAAIVETACVFADEMMAQSKQN